ncbi:hypothetical protein NDU88_006743 [Pleurodeles waltl]|uniref:Uncharacterized protein n=1 Tax=Pleurodeles waltl TaxID=8319 RepID=A0AAV7N4D0_PLEWA|nr:hypothetical protein NDU88_006743 [Pleurodeles waltl]
MHRLVNSQRELSNREVNKSENIFCPHPKWEAAGDTGNILRSGDFRLGVRLAEYVEQKSWDSTGMSNIRYFPSSSTRNRAYLTPIFRREFLALEYFRQAFRTAPLKSG